uniref:Uncharacterized protein n=2 Tax=Parascaris univalens TaxID=6257 RepID=A0A915AT17_PARUN
MHCSFRSDMRMFLQHFLFCLIFTAAGRGELKDYKKLRSCRWMIPSSYAAIGVMEDCTVVVLSPEYEDNTSPPELARNNKSCAGAQIIMIKSLVLYKEGKMKTVHFPVAFVNPHFIPISLGCDFPMKKMIYFCNLSDDFVPNTRFKVEEDAALTIHGNAISVGSHRVVLNEDGKILHYDHMTLPYLGVQGCGNNAYNKDDNLFGGRERQKVFTVRASPSSCGEALDFRQGSNLRPVGPLSTTTKRSFARFAISTETLNNCEESFEHRSLQAAI